jgi:hypothetical protein
MKTYGEVELQLHAFLTSAPGGGEWSVSRPGRFAPRERAPGTHWIGGWVGLRASLDAVAKEKFSCPPWESKPVAQLLCWLSYPGSLCAGFTALSALMLWPTRAVVFFYELEL